MESLIEQIANVGPEEFALWYLKEAPFDDFEKMFDAYFQARGVATAVFWYLGDNDGKERMWLTMGVQSFVGKPPEWIAGFWDAIAGDPSDYQFTLAALIREVSQSSFAAGMREMND